MLSSFRGPCCCVAEQSLDAIKGLDRRVLAARTPVSSSCDVKLKLSKRALAENVCFARTEEMRVQRRNPRSALDGISIPFHVLSRLRHRLFLLLVDSIRVDISFQRHIFRRLSSDRLSPNRISHTETKSPVDAAHSPAGEDATTSPDLRF